MEEETERRKLRSDCDSLTLKYHCKDSLQGTRNVCLMLGDGSGQIKRCRVFSTKELMEVITIFEIIKGIM